MFNDSRGVYNVVDISDTLAKKTAAHLLKLMPQNGEAGLTARLSVFPDDHIAKIMKEARLIKAAG